MSVHLSAHLGAITLHIIGHYRDEKRTEIAYWMCEVWRVYVDIPGVCSSEDVWSLRVTTDTSWHSLLTALSLAICCGWKVHSVIVVHYVIFYVHQFLCKPVSSPCVHCPVNVLGKAYILIRDFLVKNRPDIAIKKYTAIFFQIPMNFQGSLRAVKY